MFTPKQSFGITLLFISVNSLMAEDISDTIINNNFSLRGRYLIDESQTVPCKQMELGLCICPGSCMDSVENEYCLVRKCYQWDENLGKCDVDGNRSFAGSILMHIFLGWVGGGVGYLHQWVWFGVWWGVIVGTVVLVMFMSILCSKDCSECFSWLCGIALGLFIVITWIYLMVLIAQKDLTGPDGCKPV